MKVIPYYLGPGIRRFSSALLFDQGIEIDVPTWSHPDAPRALYSVVDEACRTGSSLAPVLLNAVRLIQLQQSHAESLKAEVDILRDYISLVSSLYPGTQRIFQSVRKIYNANRNLVATLTSTPAGATAAAFGFHWRVYEYWLELDMNPSRVLEVLEQEARSLLDPMELIMESYINRYLCTFGVAQVVGSTGDASALHPIVDSVAAAELGAACVTERHLLMNINGESNAGTTETTASFQAPIAFHLFNRLVTGRIPNIAGSESAEQLVQLLSNRKDAVVALRDRCLRVSVELIESTSSFAEFNSRLARVLSTLETEAAEVRCQDQAATRAYLRSLVEDPVLWGTAATFAGLAVGAVPDVGTFPAVVTFFARLGTEALKAQRAKSESLAKSDLRLVYYLAPDRNKG